MCVFVQRLGKRADSRSLSLAHCDLTATDTLELGETHTHYIYVSMFLLSFLTCSPLRYTTAMLASVGGDGPVMERTDRRVSSSLDLSPPACGRAQNSQALQL